MMGKTWIHFPRIGYGAKKRKHCWIVAEDRELETVSFFASLQLLTRNPDVAANV
jgi:hypothetical protein